MLCSTAAVSPRGECFPQHRNCKRGQGGNGAVRSKAGRQKVLAVMEAKHTTLDKDYFTINYSG